MDKENLFIEREVHSVLIIVEKRIVEQNAR